MLRARRRFEQLLEEEQNKPHSEEAYQAPAVLFMAVKDSDCSQMAAALLRAMSAGPVRVFSGGSAPASRVDPKAVTVLSERGIDIVGANPARLSAAMFEAAEVVVDLGEENSPVVVEKRYLQWKVESPEGKSLKEMRRARDEIERLVWELMILLNIEPRRL